jgi:hypothetical protein
VWLIGGLPWQVQRRSNAQVRVLGGELRDRQAVPAATRHIELAADGFGVVSHQEGAQAHGFLSESLYGSM